MASCNTAKDIAYIYGYGYRDLPVVNEEGRIVYVHECESELADLSEGSRCSDYFLEKRQSENNEK